MDLALGLAGALAFPPFAGFLVLGAFGFAGAFLGVLVFGFFSFLAGLAFLAGEAAGWAAGASTLGASAWGSLALVTFAVLGALAAFGLAAALGLDLLAFWD